MTAPSHRILVIDDNPAIHEDFRKILCPSKIRADLKALEAALFDRADASQDRIPFELDSAYQGQDGLALVEKALAEGRPYAVAFVDVRMPPGWDGIETTTRIWQTYPELQVVICTAFSDYSWDQMARQLGASDNMVILKKPFDNVEALQLAHALARKWWLSQQNKLRLEDLHQMVQARTRELEQANATLKQEITMRAQAEEGLRQAQKMEAVGQLAAGVAHDFNNLLTIIQGHVSLQLETPDLDPDMAESLQEIGTAAQRAAHLTRQLVAFSRKQFLQRRALDLNAFLGDRSEMLTNLLRGPFRLCCHYARDLRPVFADPNSLEQVLTNLVTNAREAMGESGTLALTTSLVTIDEVYVQKNREARPGCFVCLQVEDTGCGMDTATLSRIFEPFFTTKEFGQGTGMGLAMVYGILKQHEGWIEVASQVHSGTCFKIYLPVCS